MGHARKNTPPVANEAILKENRKSASNDNIKQAKKKNRVAIVFLGDFQR